jgi:hypothetical protein
MEGRVCVYRGDGVRAMGLWVDQSFDRKDLGPHGARPAAKKAVSCVYRDGMCAMDHCVVRLNRV